MVLVILAVMWVVVLVPPLLRSRQDSRPSDSVVSFRRQLSTLQRTGPQLRPVGRAQAAARSGARSLSGAGSRSSRSAYGLSYGSSYGSSGGYGNGYGHAGYGAARPAYAAGSYRMSRVAVRRRRQNVLFVLAVAAAGTLLLALGSQSAPVWYAHVVADVLLAGYLYLLVQLRKLEEQRDRGLGPVWSSAA